MKRNKEYSQSTLTLSVADPDPLHLAGSGSTSGNVDQDPGSKEINRTRIKINQHY